jgi:23S rRNA pseudouridine1911/1915/1917 synthase
MLSTTSGDPEILLITEENEGIRIDRLLTEHYPEYSRTYFQKLIEQGFVLLNGQPVKKRIEPEEGDEIEVCFQYTHESPAQPEDIQLEILYEDEHFLAINKPPGMVVHPAPGHNCGTFVNALLFYCKQIASLDPLRPGIVHRLDKETSGVLLAAKTARAHQKLVEKFAAREMEKTYLAFCIGKPRSGLLSAPLGRHPVHRKEMAVLPDGKEAITDIQILAFNDKLSFVLAKPKTGRTHQIRVHLKHAGAPVLGDAVYGSAKANLAFDAKRQMLHAYRIAFTHPITAAPITIAAPIPKDLQFWMHQLSQESLLVNPISSK